MEVLETGWWLDDKAPKMSTWVPRLPDDIKALETLLEGGFPPKQRIWPTKQAVIIYKFGDASGSGFGSSFTIDSKVYYRHGKFSTDHSQESSNNRESANSIFAIEDAHEKGLFHEAKLLIFTDNATMESAFFRGTSKHKKPFELIICFRKLQLGDGVIIYVVHVAGLKMIAQGTDVLSWGTTTSGVMQGWGFCSFVLLRFSALERQGKSLKSWVESWFQSPNMINWLEPKDWFQRGHQLDFSVWTPPSVVAEVAFEQLGKMVHKRPYYTHLMLCLQLMTAHWS